MCTSFSFHYKFINKNQHEKMFYDLKLLVWMNQTWCIVRAKRRPGRQVLESTWSSDTPVCSAPIHKLWRRIWDKNKQIFLPLVCRCSTRKMVDAPSGYQPIIEPLIGVVTTKFVRHLQCTFCKTPRKQRQHLANLFTSLLMSKTQSSDIRPRHTSLRFKSRFQ